MTDFSGISGLFSACFQGAVIFQDNFLGQTAVFQLSIVVSLTCTGYQFGAFLSN